MWIPWKLNEILKKNILNGLRFRGKKLRIKEGEKIGIKIFL
jgi:hypothetical protein